MRVFVTGASGFIGSAIVQELMSAGHQVVGLARSESSSSAVAAMGAEVHRGDLEALDSLRSGVSACDGVIHAGFIHDFSRFKVVCEIDRRAIEEIGAVLAGSDKPFVVTSAVANVSPGRQATENDAPTRTSADFPRIASEEAAQSVAGRGVRVAVVRLPPSVHGDGDHGFVPTLIQTARQTGVSAYIGEGLNRWTAVHQLDAARLYVLALENGAAGARYHCLDEEGIAFKDIAAVVGSRLTVPVVSKPPGEAATHFGALAHFVQLDIPASSQITRQQLGWQPKQPQLIGELQHSGRYFAR